MGGRGKGWAPLGTIQEEVCRWQVLRGFDVQESSHGEEGHRSRGLLCCPTENGLGPHWGGLAGWPEELGPDPTGSAFEREVLEK